MTAVAEKRVNHGEWGSFFYELNSHKYCTASGVFIDQRHDVDGQEYSGYVINPNEDHFRVMSVGRLGFFAEYSTVRRLRSIEELNNWFDKHRVDQEKIDKEGALAHYVVDFGWINFG